MSTDQTKTSEWAREKARKIHGDYQRAAWSMLAGSTVQEVEAARIEHLALALDAAVAERDEAMERCRTDWNHEVLRLRARLAAAEKVVEAAEGMHDTIAVRSLTPDGLYRRIDAALLAVPLAYLRSAINYYHASKGGTQ